MADSDVVRIARSRKEALREEIRRIEELLDKALALLDEDEVAASAPVGGAQIIRIDHKATAEPEIDGESD